MRRRFNWKPYVPVSERKEKAKKRIKMLRKQGLKVNPITINGRKIARTFWGEAWCKHLEKFSDFSNRLPRGRTYVRNGSVCHLEIKKGKIKAMVAGTRLYTTTISVGTLPGSIWADIKKRCSGKIGSLLELLQGKLSRQVMQIVTNREKGLFPLPKEIQIHCNCPDWAVMCKHASAVLYGAGARFDEKPELLFRLRGVDHKELTSDDFDLSAATEKAAGARGAKRIKDDDVSALFGIEIDTTPPEEKAGKKGKKRKKKKTKKTKKAKKTKRGKKKTAAPPPTGGAVAKLRKKRRMSRKEFAGLLGVSPSTIRNWEHTKGRLTLQSRTLKAWKKLAKQ